MDIKNISLIGMPGSGKSTIVKRLATALNFTWIDTDLLIESWFGRPLQEIRDRLGNKNFLKAEEFIVLNLYVNRCVIATGGSVIYSERAMRHLKKSGPIVYLRCQLEEIEKRISMSPHRGLVIENGQSIKDLYMERSPLYSKYSDFVVDTDRFSVSECVNKIANLIQTQG
ncbi:homoserine kinase [Desulfothermus okinawensis JCM 13304]